MKNNRCPILKNVLFIFCYNFQVKDMTAAVDSVTVVNILSEQHKENFYEKYKSFLAHFLVAEYS